jgi:hypothetical protein
MSGVEVPNMIGPVGGRAPALERPARAGNREIIVNCPSAAMRRSRTLVRATILAAGLDLRLEVLVGDDPVGKVAAGSRYGSNLHAAAGASADARDLSPIASVRPWRASPAARERGREASRSAEPWLFTTMPRISSAAPL